MTSSGIVLPDTASDQPMEGSVLSVGPGRVLDTGKRVEMDVQVGDSVLFAKYTGSQVNLQGDEYLVIRESERAGIVDPAKVTRSALENAASVAGMILSTEALVTDLMEGHVVAAAAGARGMYDQ